MMGSDGTGWKGEASDVIGAMTRSGHDCARTAQMVRELANASSISIAVDLDTNHDDVVDCK